MHTLRACGATDPICATPAILMYYVRKYGIRESTVQATSLRFCSLLLGYQDRPQLLEILLPWNVPHKLGIFVCVTAATTWVVN